ASRTRRMTTHGTCSPPKPPGQVVPVECATPLRYRQCLIEGAYSGHKIGHLGRIFLSLLARQVIASFPHSPSSNADGRSRGLTNPLPPDRSRHAQCSPVLRLTISIIVFLLKPTFRQIRRWHGPSACIPSTRVAFSSEGRWPTWRPSLTPLAEQLEQTVAGAHVRGPCRKS